MQAQEQPVLRDIVLVGGGHSHVGVIKRFGMNPVPGLRLTVICRDTHTPYSGMLPGYVAGHYAYDEVHIDLRRLAEFAKARFISDEAIGLDRSGKKVLCRNRPAVPYDKLSINIGSAPQVSLVPGAADFAVPVKPIHAFNERWLALLQRVKAQTGAARIAVVGGGAGGVELTLAMQYRLHKELRALGRDPQSLSFDLFTASDDILPTHNNRVRANFEHVLRQRGVTLHRSAEVKQVSQGRLQTGDGTSHAADEIVWVTQAGGAAWLHDTGLKLDANGFIEVGDTLQTVTDPDVFAAGDIANMINHPREKAGVFAVRQGRPLADNLRRSVTGESLLPYRPQRHWLALISTGDQFAVASRGGFSVKGDWVWRWKDWIDRRFMRKFSEFPAMDGAAGASASGGAGAAIGGSGAGGIANAVGGAGGTFAGGTSSGGRVALNNEEAQQAISAIAMRCGGCGAKVGATVLSRALGSLTPIERDDVLIGLHSPDDAAIVRVPRGMAMVHTVDFFRAFIDDPYIFGKVAANHSLGDIWAMGGQAQSATAVVTVPPGLESKVEDVLFQMMSGAVEVLNEADCALVGGHTGEGRELALGFAVNGLIDEDIDKAVMRKGGMKAGDVVLLTKPIGTGTLFAAHAKLQARGRWIDAALTSMVQSNRVGAQVLLRHGATACTDLTGFGLLGHLVEMTRPSGVDVELKLSALPILDGAQETVQLGILSSLQPANVRLRRALRDQAQWVKHPRYPLIFDPQTAGGLLATVPGDKAQACIDELRTLGYPHTMAIGRVLPQGDALEPISLVE